MVAFAAATADLVTRVDALVTSRILELHVYKYVPATAAFRSNGVASIVKKQLDRLYI